MTLTTFKGQLEKYRGEHMSDMFCLPFTILLHFDVCIEEAEERSDSSQRWLPCSNLHMVHMGRRMRRD